MIRVDQKPEPANFDELVHQPGLKFLASVPVGSEPDFKNRDYWRLCRAEIRSAYDAICAYTSFYVEAVTGFETVEHFLPKKAFPERAYDWTNYRFVCGRMNGRKGNRINIVDPFEIVGDLFFLDIPSMLLRVNPLIDHDTMAKAERTIQVLGLNDERCASDRLAWLRDLTINEISLSYLERRAPFLARELQRQNLDVAALRDLGLSS